MREGFDAQQVCHRGHQQTANYHSYPQFRRKFCETCGTSTFHQCPGCNADIPGDYHVSNVVSIGGDTPVPSFCQECGFTFPWGLPESKQAQGSAVPAFNPMELLSRLCRRFPIVVRELRHRRQGRNTLDVTDEYDVQDLLNALLHQFFDDVRAEEVVPSYAGKSSRMDFLLNNEAIAVEAKMTRPGLSGKEIGEQLIVDIARYQAHPKCKNLLCLVYDPEHRIRNPRGLESDLSKQQDGLNTLVFIVS